MRRIWEELLQPFDSSPRARHGDTMLRPRMGSSADWGDKVTDCISALNARVVSLGSIILEVAP
jgi:hypothetical protein